MGKFIVPMFDSMMLFIAKIHHAIIRFKYVHVHNGIFLNLVSNDVQKNCGRTVSVNLIVHPAAPFDQT